MADETEHLENQTGPIKKIVFLNHFLSRSSTHAPRAFAAPRHSARELLSILEQRRAKGFAVEYFGKHDEDDDLERIAKGLGSSFIKIKNLSFETDGGCHYAVLFVEYVNKDEKEMPVVHIVTHEGREISGEEGEVGAYATHVVVKLKGDEDYDDGRYRCAIEYNPAISRKNIAGMLSTQLRRYAKVADLSFDVSVQKGKKPPKLKSYKYKPKIELLADVGRRLAGTMAGKDLSLMVFTKRSVKQDTGGETEIIDEEVYGDVEIRIAAKQGPQEPAAKLAWSDRLRSIYTSRGFDAKMYFKNASGDIFSGQIDSHIEGAADLLMCPKELIELSSEPRRWRSSVDRETVDRMKELLERDDLWERAK